MYVSFTNLGRFVPAVTISRFCNGRVEEIVRAQSGELLKVTVEEGQQLIRNHYAEAIPEDEQLEEEAAEEETPVAPRAKRTRGRRAKRSQKRTAIAKEVGDVNPV